MKITHNKKQLAAVLGSIFLLICLSWYGIKYFLQLPAPVVEPKSALNAKLPVSDSIRDLNKDELYAKAERDSAIKAELRSRDPYIPKTPGIASKNTETDINIRMDRLYADIEKPVSPRKKLPAVTEPEPIKLPFFKVDPPQQPVDPEMQQLSGMLDKIILIQNPQKLKPKVTIDSTTVIKANKTRTIQAVVQGDQLLVNGSTIKLRLLQDISINEVTIPRGNFVYGTCQVNNERLVVQLTNLIYNAQVYPFPLHVYDIDGIEGIYIPGAISREVSKDGADNAIQSLNIGTYDASITGQVAAAGIQTAKSLLSKKVKLIRVTARSGHVVFLQNPNAITSR